MSDYSDDIQPGTSGFSETTPTLDGTELAQAPQPRPSWRETKQKKYRKALVEKQKATPKPLKTWATEMLNNLRTLDADSRQQKARDIGTFYQYYDCNEYGEFDEAGIWQPLADDGKLQYSMPIVPAHVDSAKTILLKTVIEYEYEAKSKDAVVDQQLARMCEELAEEDVERAFTDNLRSLEIIYLLLAGDSFRYPFWGPNETDPQTAEIPAYSYEPAEMPSTKMCGNAECGARVRDEDAVCRKCQSSDIVTTEGAKTWKWKTTPKTISIAENQLHIPNPLAVQHDLSKININHSSIFVERDTLPRSEAEFLYCQVIPKGDVTISQELVIIRELERLRLKTGNAPDNDAAMLGSAFAADTDTDIVQRERAWIAPYRYANVLITEEHWYFTKADGLIWCADEAEIPENAKHIKPGTVLGDHLPNGLFLCAIDGLPVEINEGQIPDWIKLTCGVRPANANGSGLRRLRPLADMANDSTNLDFTVAMEDASPTTFVNRKFASNLSQTGNYTLVDNMGESDSKENVAWRLQGTGSHPQNGVMGEKAQGFSQFLVGTFSSMGPGAPDAKAAGTATGVIAMTEESTGRFIEPTRSIRAADIKLRHAFLKNRQRFSVDPQKQEMAERFGKEVVQKFLTCGNLQKYVTIRAKRGTDAPQSKAVKMGQMQVFGQVASQLANHPDAVSILSDFADTIDMPLATGPGMNDREEARRRLGLLREGAKQFAEVEISFEEAMLKAIGLVGQVLEKTEGNIPGLEEAAEVEAQAPPILPVNPMLAQNPELPVEAMPPPAPPVEELPPPIPSVDVLRLNHKLMKDEYNDFLSGEGARLNNKVLECAVKIMWELHEQREQEQALYLVRRAAEQELEVEKIKQKFAESMLPPTPSPEDVAAQEDAAKEEGLATELAGRAADEQSKQTDFERKEAAKDEDLDREILKEEHRQELAKENTENEKPEK